MTKPPHGTEEWADSNVNIQDGCEHDCKYCYAKAYAIRFHRKSARTWKKPKLRQRDLKKGYMKRKGRIMFPSSHDITEHNLDNCVRVLKKILQGGNEVLIVMKPSFVCTKILCKELVLFKSRMTFRFTIGSADNAVLQFWEPNSPSFHERMKALRHAYRRGFSTSVSCEPMLDDNVYAVIDAVRPYVTDSIWLGKANQLRQIVKLNCPNDNEATRLAGELIAVQKEAAIFTLYQQYRSDPLIKWKDSIKKVIGLKRPSGKGLDI